MKAEAEVKNLEVLEAEMEVVCVEAYCCSCSFSSQSFIKQILLNSQSISGLILFSYFSVFQKSVISIFGRIVFLDSGGKI